MGDAPRKGGRDGAQGNREKERRMRCHCCLLAPGGLRFCRVASRWPWESEDGGRDRCVSSVLLLLPRPRKTFLDLKGGQI